MKNILKYTFGIIVGFLISHVDYYYKAGKLIDHYNKVIIRQIDKAFYIGCLLGAKNKREKIPHPDIQRCGELTDEHMERMKRIWKR